MAIAFALLFIVILLLTLEKIFVTRCVNKLRIRIIVNGTRGKSTVTKYVSLLLRSNNIPTISKITGIIPTIQAKRGNEEEVKRRGPARVTEQFKIIRKACKEKVESLVLENMTINPELQKIESASFKPHFYIITNIREDHLEETGFDPAERVKAICEAIPRNSIVITAERKYRNEIESQTFKKKSRFIHIDDSLKEKIELTNTSLIYDNVAIAICVAKELNLITESFLQTINEIKSEQKSEIILNDHKINFINGFAINDVPSAKILLNGIDIKGQNQIIIFNSRADRPLRSKQFVEWFSQLENISRFIITGDHIGYTNREMIKRGLDKNKITVWKKNESKNAKEKLSKLITNSTSIIGFGNIKNDGFNIINSLRV